jgi:hypothetical protein
VTTGLVVQHRGVLLSLLPMEQFRGPQQKEA